MRGIDVSSYQGVVDWNKVKAAGVKFAILKVIRRDLNPDKQFENNWNGCKSAGVPIQGVYNYSYATTVEKATSDAEKVIQVLNGRKTFVWLDVEDNCQKNLGETLINIINAYKAKIEATGCSFGVYTGLSFYGSYIKQYSDKVNCPFWIARYPSKANMSVTDNPDASKKPVINHELYGWQYASTGQVPGIVGNVDMNDYYKAIEEKSTVAPVQHAHKTGEVVTVSSYYASSTDGVEKAIIKTQTDLTIGRVLDTDVHNPYRLDRDGVATGWCNDGDIRSTGATPAKKSNEEIAKEVIAGKWGVQPERQKKLEAAGYSYETIRALVNAKEGKSAQSKSYYPRYTGSSVSIVDALIAVGADGSKENRKKIATTNGISSYEGNASQNAKMLKLLKTGKLIK